MRVWLCRVCGDRAETDDDKVAYFHRCYPPTRPRRRRYSIPELEEVDREEIHQKAFYSLEDALGEAALRGGVE